MNVRLFFGVLAWLQRGRFLAGASYMFNLVTVTKSLEERL
jgi:hypothetical protein